MLYLATHYLWFLIAAVAIGLVIGWIGREEGRGGSLWPVAAIVLVGILAGSATGLEWVNGRAALWVDTGLLFLASYVAGCLIGHLLAGRRTAAFVTAGDAGAALPGERPPAQSLGPADKPDEIALIRGIGPENERRLHRLGIYRFDQIAAWTPQNAEWVGSFLAFPGRIEREDWIGQARAFAAGRAGLD